MAALRRLASIPRSMLLQLSRKPRGRPMPASASGSSVGCSGSKRFACYLSSCSWGNTLAAPYGFKMDIVGWLCNRSRMKPFVAIHSFHATGLHHAIDLNYYEVLGVSKSASQDDIKKAFLGLAKKYHPDAAKYNNASKKKFLEIRDAYDTLRDPDKRAQYDRKLFGGEKDRNAADDARQSHYSHGHAAEGENFHHTSQDPFSYSFYKVFSEVFEDGEISAPDVHVQLNLTFSEAAKGCFKKVSFAAHVLCDSCYGRGYPKNAKPMRCRVCKGRGKVTIFPFTSTCTDCKGVGEIFEDVCLVCKGSGLTEGVKNVNVTIPAGVDSGDTIHVPKAGNNGRKAVQPGSLYIKFQIDKDPVFERDGADVYVESRISYIQAMLGGHVDVPTLLGKKRLKIPKGVQPGQLLVLRGIGFPGIGSNDRGDQHVRFRVTFPSKVNDRQRALLEEFANEEAMQESSSSEERNWLYQQLSTG